MITLLKRLQNGHEERPPLRVELTTWRPMEDEVEDEVGKWEVEEVKEVSPALSGCHYASGENWRQGHLLMLLVRAQVLGHLQFNSEVKEKEW